jgi:DNA-binding response OmpR family regulator
MSYAHELATLSLPNPERYIISRLAQEEGGIVAKPKLIDFVYRDRVDGGPSAARQTVEKYIDRVRRKISPHGWTIKAELYRGYRLVRLS